MDVSSFEKDCVLAVRRWHETNEVLGVFNFNSHPVHAFDSIPHGVWHKRFDSAETRWMGSDAAAPETIGAGRQNGFALRPHGVLLYEKEIED